MLSLSGLNISGAFKRWLLIPSFILLTAQLRGQSTLLSNLRASGYWDQKPVDECTKLLDKVAAKQVRLNSTNQEALTRSLLDALNVPASSQLLVFSGTASQGNRVSYRNPRAIYFNDEVYIGMVPTGFVEMIGIDPEIGGVFYSFEKMKDGSYPTAVRGEDCMRCHATSASGLLPGMVLRSLIPSLGVNTKSEIINHTIAGHQIPLSERFGGWHVTSSRPFGETQEGLIIKDTGRKEHLRVGQNFDQGKHVARTSDILAHLVHEHQAGFVNRVMAVVSQARSEARPGKYTTPAASTRIDQLERELVRYVLFADEARLPSEGISGNAAFIKDFSRNRRPSKSGIALKDLDLKTRMFATRCSYMIYTSAWQGLPPAIKTRLYARIKDALAGKDEQFAYLTAEERRNIVTILRDTLPDLPADWR